jgi:hypothetical protein
LELRLRGVPLTTGYCPPLAGVKVVVCVVKIGVSARSKTLFGNVIDKKLCFEKSGNEVETRDFAILWSSWDIQETEFPGDLVFPNRVLERAVKSRCQRQPNLKHHLPI